MLKIKLFVLMIYFSSMLAYRTKYCKICENHTLCKYEVPGPSRQCIGYDTNALLTEDDINAILDKINERRNFIAIGKSRFLPVAANMRKIEWSAELATFAQRWVDQCDPSLKPDRPDQCRDLDNLKVGQSIATATGMSTRYNVKSFVEMWFMESMNYVGSVMYYNQSRDYKTNYFSQLIWADTDKVGCGKAKFFIKNAKPIIIERLVCNFAPKGNVDGKPVYTIGYAATQCDKGLSSDRTYHGLCSHQIIPNDKLISTYPPATSFLRIRNLLNNDSSSQEIDPIYNNAKQMRKDFNIMDVYNHQSPVQILNTINNSYDRHYPFRNEKVWNLQILNASKHHGDYLQKREKEHSKVTHDHGHRNEFDSLHRESYNQNVLRYTTTDVNSYVNQDYRKHNTGPQCTRKFQMKLNNYAALECIPCKQKLNKCTRGQKNKCRENNDCQMTTHKRQSNGFRTNSQQFCACSFLADYPSSPNRCVQNNDYDCINLNCPTKPRPHILRTFRDISDEKVRDVQYYEMLTNIAEQSTRKAILKMSPRTRDILSNNNFWTPHSKHQENLDRRKQLMEINYSERNRRVAKGEENMKPFWQMDEYANKNQPPFKSMRYTTLANKHRLKYKETRKSNRTPIKTESITIVHKGLNKNEKRITEKYLSFDELMHLRKHNPQNLGRRRYDDEKQVLRESNPSTTTEEATTSQGATPIETTTEYTFNTPYIRMKYCTRKLTCTWTAASLTDSAGSIIPGGGAGAVGGSRTPPGYVEGCTRTSTCTRDYMNRNKMATLPIETTSPQPEPGDEEDYCERRSLNRRSNENLVQANQSNIYFLSYVPKQKSLSNESFVNASNTCICYDKILRNKRHDYNHKEPITYSRYKNVKRESKNHVMKNDNNLLSYGELFYYLVQKIIQMKKTTKSEYSRDKCLCNDVNKLRSCKLFLLLTIILKYFIIFL